jgi:LPS export ABC transporter protein LptC
MMYRVFIVVVFIAVIIGSILLGGQQREPVSTTTIDESAGDLGYAARQARVTETGPDGHPLYTIDADLINEPPGTANIQLQRMRMSFRDAAGNEWTGRADTGVAAQDTGKVELLGDVQVSGVLPGLPDEANIRTEKLFVDTHDQTVTTDEPVTLAAGKATVRANGLSTNLNDGVVHLESNVHGTFSP